MVRFSAAVIMGRSVAVHDDKKNGCVGDDHEADEAHCVPVSWAS